ncbi:MAG: hypothetical protein WBM62_18745 [Crocosphaera sp.]
MSICLLYSALVHLGNIFSLGEVTWLETPLHWRLMDIILLIFDVIVFVSLWVKPFNGIIAFIVGIFLLQIVPYTIFRQYFILKPEDGDTLNSLIATEISLITILIVLIIAKK